MMSSNNIVYAHTKWSITFCVSNTLSERLDKFICKLPISINRTQLKKYCVQATINNLPVKLSSKITYKDIISLHFDMTESLSLIIPQDKDPLATLPPILYEDNYTLVLDKPRGQAMHAGAGTYQGTVAHAIFPFLKSYTQEDYITHRAGITHRLDKDTSGAVLVAKTIEAQQHYIKQFSKRFVRKEYISIVKGIPSKMHAVIETSIIRNPHNRKSFISHRTNGKPAISEYTVLYTNNTYSVIKWYIFTGRTHQIRVHAHHIQCPILGDTIYSRMTLQEKQNMPLCLHAQKLSLKLYQKEKQEFSHYQLFIAPIPKDFQDVCTRIGYTI